MESLKIPKPSKEIFWLYAYNLSIEHNIAQDIELFYKVKIRKI